MNTLRYPTAMIGLHWLTVLAVAAAYLSSGNPLTHPAIGMIHVTSGLSVAALCCLRIVVRLLCRKQIPHLPMPKRQRQLAHFMEMLLYVCMLAIPLTGWLALGLKTSSYTLFGQNLPLSGSIHSLLLQVVVHLHPVFGNVFVTLAGLHALAALFHHFFQKDGVLLSMTPCHCRHQKQPSSPNE